jgi:hypothetical protein
MFDIFNYIYSGANFGDNPFDGTEIQKIYLNKIRKKLLELNIKETY